MPTRGMEDTWIRGSDVNSFCCYGLVYVLDSWSWLRSLIEDHLHVYKRSKTQLHGHTQAGSARHALTCPLLFVTLSRWGRPGGRGRGGRAGGQTLAGTPLLLAPLLARGGVAPARHPAPPRAAAVPCPCPATGAHTGWGGGGGGSRGWGLGRGLDRGRHKDRGGQGQGQPCQLRGLGNTHGESGGGRAQRTYLRKTAHWTIGHYGTRLAQEGAREHDFCRGAVTGHVRTVTRKGKRCTKAVRMSTASGRSHTSANHTHRHRVGTAAGAH